MKEEWWAVGGGGGTWSCYPSTGEHGSQSF